MKNLPVGQYAVAFQDLVLMTPEEEKQKERNNRKETHGRLCCPVVSRAMCSPDGEGGWLGCLVGFCPVEVLSFRGE